MKLSYNDFKIWKVGNRNIKTLCICVWFFFFNFIKFKFLMTNLKEIPGAATSKRLANLSPISTNWFCYLTHDPLLGHHPIHVGPLPHQEKPPSWERERGLEHFGERQKGDETLKSEKEEDIF